MRWNLIDAVEVLAIPRDEATPERGPCDNLGFAASIILDWFDLNEPDEEHIGRILLDKKELDVACSLGVVFCSMIDEIEPSNDDLDYRRHPKWPQLERLANIFLTLLYRDFARDDQHPHPDFRLYAKLS